MKKSLFKNLRFQSYLQLLNTVIPLITTPYVARALGAKNIGIFTFTHSVATYFTLFAMLGTNNYGTRSIACSKNDEEKYKVFWAIYSLQIATVVVSTILYLLYCHYYSNSGNIAYIHCLTLFGCLFNVQWFYYGLEEFQTTVTYHMLCRVVSIIALFVFVKTENDLFAYTLVMVIGESFAYVLLWSGKFLKKKIPFRRVSLLEIKRHIKPNILLFIPLMAMSIYHYMDKTMIGLLSTYDQVGYYYNVEKIINVPLGIFTGISTVLLPRMTILFSRDKNNALDFFNKTLDIILMFGFAMCFGIIAISKEFIPIFLGEQYSSCIKLVNIFAPVLIIKCFSNAVRTQLLIPAKLESVYIRATITGAGVNLIANAILIPKSGALGAEIATIISELVALFIEVICVRSELKLDKVFIESVVYTTMGLIMVIAVKVVSPINTGLLFQIGAKIIVGFLVYTILAAMYSFLSKNILFEYIYTNRKWSKKA